jgi:FtsP/CotA-like multicopper oxidase with cupredoxin domain
MKRATSPHIDPSGHGDDPSSSISRRDAVLSGAALIAGAATALRTKDARAEPPPPTALGPGPYVPIVTPNNTTLPWTLKDGVKEFRLVAEPVQREFAPGMLVNGWGYNASLPGPTIEAVEGDRVRIFVTNKLPERTAVHWHGFLLPNGMDGVAGLTQPHIEPGETYVYEFTLRQHGVQMYHPHSDEMVQIALGMMGFFVIHPRVLEAPRIDRHFAIMLNEWFIPPGAATPNPAVMLDFNLFTFNARVWPGTDPLVVRTGQRVRLSFGNVSMDSHPIHVHGHRFLHVGTDGGPVPPSARVPMTTINVPPGTTQTVEFVADAPGDWALHCHKSHHTMNAMSHDLPNMIGTQPGASEEKIRKVLPAYMAMGQTGMGKMMDMGHPKNTLPMMSGKGQFGEVEMGGMFTILKVRDGITSYEDPGWYKHPTGTLARKVSV